MKFIVSISFLTCILATSVNAQLSYQPAKSSYRFGGGYTRYSEENGFVFFNEAQFHIWNNLTAGPGVYVARTIYGIDNKNNATYLYGIDFNVYYSIKICKSSAIQLGPGYTFRHKDSYTGSEFWGWEDPQYEKSNLSQFSANLNIDKALSNRFNIGLKTSWQPMGTQESMFYAAVYGGFVFQSMQSHVINLSKDDYTLTTDRSKIDVTAVHHFLSTEAYWSKNIPFEKVKTAIENSLCFGVFHKEKQVGFARVLTDYAAIAYLGDVYILPEYREKGLSKWLMETIMSHPNLQGLRRWILLTRSAHELYKKYGWKPIANPGFYMEVHKTNPYE